eukprot:1161837-Pelagomonas_calceolata.AAC.8
MYTSWAPYQDSQEPLDDGHIVGVERRQQREQGKGGRHPVLRECGMKALSACVQAGQPAPDCPKQHRTRIQGSAVYRSSRLPATTTCIPGISAQ